MLLLSSQYHRKAKYTSYIVITKTLISFSLLVTSSNFSYQNAAIIIQIKRLDLQYSISNKADFVLSIYFLFSLLYSMYSTVLMHKN